MTEKELREHRAGLVEEAQTLLNACEEQNRAFNADDNKRYIEIKEELGRIDATLEAQENVRAGWNRAPKPQTGQTEEEQQRAQDEQELMNYIRGIGNTRANSAGVSEANNANIIPKTIANKVIETVKDLSPIYDKAEKFFTSGTLEIPVYGDDGSADGNTGKIMVAYQGSEFGALTQGVGKFTAKELKGYSHGALTLISNKMIANTELNVTSYLERKMSEAFADFYEGELLKGTGSANSHMGGACSTTNKIYAGDATLTAAAAATVDNAIDIQLAVKQRYQSNACWIMGLDMFKAFRKLKDSNNNYYLLYGRGLGGGFGWELLGSPVYLSENMSAATTANNVPLIYGDMSGMALKLTRNLRLQLLRETYATQDALGIVAWAEADSVLTDPQKIAALIMADAG